MPRCRSFLIEERIRPHPGLIQALIGPTLCTAPVLTIIARDGRPQNRWQHLQGAARGQSASITCCTVPMTCWIRPGTVRFGRAVRARTTTM